MKKVGDLVMIKGVSKLHYVTEVRDTTLTLDGTMIVSENDVEHFFTDIIDPDLSRYSLLAIYDSNYPEEATLIIQIEEEEEFAAKVILSYAREDYERHNKTYKDCISLGDHIIKLFAIKGIYGTRISPSEINILI